MAAQVPGLIDGKASKIGSSGSAELESMRSIAEAYKERSLAKLIVTMEKYPKELKVLSLLALLVQMCKY